MKLNECACFSIEFDLSCKHNIEVIENKKKPLVQHKKRFFAFVFVQYTIIYRI